MHSEKCIIDRYIITIVIIYISMRHPLNCMFSGHLIEEVVSLTFSLTLKDGTSLPGVWFPAHSNVTCTGVKIDPTSR